MPSHLDKELLTAAIAGYQAKLSEIEQQMAELRRRIGTPQASAPAAPVAAAPKRILSAEGRARIVEAVKKRWAAAKAVTAPEPPKPAVKAKPTAAKKSTAKKRAAKPAAPPSSPAKKAPVKSAQPQHKSAAKKSSRKAPAQAARRANPAPTPTPAPSPETPDSPATA